ncbi:helix-turn-helix domain-containing protein [Streptomyces xanthochromogenes]|uniref:helix-turn-helix domain-containing protein n=1 Tax=Streptomyces xanthochromogenes TaxID=67384 RepID=UPI003419CDA5
MTQSTADTKDTDAMSPLPTPKERRRLREAKDLSEAQVASAVGVTRATVRSWETGRTTPRGRKGQTYARLLATIEVEMAAEEEMTGAEMAGAEMAGAEDSVSAPPADGGSAEPRQAAPPDDAGKAEKADAADAADDAETPAKPTPKAKQHAANTRPKAAADGASPKSSRPWGRAAKQQAAPHPRPGRAAPEPAASGSAPVPVPSKELRPAAPDRGATPGAAAAPATLADALPEQASVPHTFTPAEAFDALYTAIAPDLARQAYLLTGRTRLARESVERAFHQAWENWPEVATDRDPAGWVRAAAYEYAMAPWHRFRRAYKRPDQPPAEPERRALLDALLDLPPAYRRTVLLYDGVGLDLPETAAETEASTPAAANRVLNARTAILDRVPSAARATPQALSADLRRRITDLALAGPESVTRLPAAPVVRTGGERRRRFWTRAAIAFTTLIVSATAFTVVTVPHHHVRPVPIGERVGGVPANNGPQRLTGEDLELRNKLRTEPARGPHRLVLDIR